VPFDIFEDISQTNFQTDRTTLQTATRSA